MSSASNPSGCPSAPHSCPRQPSFEPAIDGALHKASPCMDPRLRNPHDTFVCTPEPNTSPSSRRGGLCIVSSIANCTLGQQLESLHYWCGFRPMNTYLRLSLVCNRFADVRLAPGLCY
ncbi:hypothetical protein TgHK011_004652 [Trichoderma gracile]|nr:hypothetical protein TgHK011_004652 [Trichoderma gracile]